MKIDTFEESLRQALQLPPEAVSWIMALWNAIQVFDDYADGDPVERSALDATIWDTLVSMPTNPFFLKNVFTLGPALGLAVLKWQASDKVEREGKANAQSYMWRAGFYDVILAVVQCVHGPAAATAIADKVLGLYGETWEQYKEEFNA